MPITKNKYFDIIFSVITGATICFIYLINAPNYGTLQIFIPWDGYVHQTNQKIIDFSTLTITSLEYFRSMPDYYYNVLINKYTTINEYKARIFPTIISSFLISYFSCKLLAKEIKSYFFLANLFLLNIIIFCNIPFQWLINDGVMLSIGMQIGYALYLLALIIALSDIKNKSIILIPLGITIIITGMWTFLSIFPLTLMCIFIITPLLIKEKVLNSRRNIYILIVNFILIVLIGFTFLKIVLINHFDIYNLSATSNSELISGGGYKNLQGGILYQIYGLSDYTMYAKNTANFFGTMEFHFEYYLPQALTVALYISVLFKYALKKNDLILCSSALLLIIYLFLSKGNQYPFGFIYEYFLHNFKIFQSIRTPDTKFGIYTFSLLALILIKFISESKLIFNSIISFILIGYLVICMPPLISKETTHGQLSENGTGRMYSNNLEPDRKLIELLEKYDSENCVGVLFPGHGYIRTPGGDYAFRDYLEFKINYLINYSKAVNGKYGELLKNVQISDSKNSNFKIWLKSRNVSYIVIRKSTNIKNLFCVDCMAEDPQFTKIYDDLYTTVFLTDTKCSIDTAHTESKLPLSIISYKYYVFFLLIIIFIMNLMFPIRISDGMIKK